MSAEMELRECLVCGAIVKFERINAFGGLKLQIRCFGCGLTLSRFTIAHEWERITQKLVQFWNQRHQPEVVGGDDCVAGCADLVFAGESIRMHVQSCLNDNGRLIGPDPHAPKVNDWPTLTPKRAKELLAKGKEAGKAARKEMGKVLDAPIPSMIFRASEPTKAPGCGKEFGRVQGPDGMTFIEWCLPDQLCPTCSQPNDEEPRG